MIVDICSHFIWKFILDAIINIIHIFLKKTYIQAHTTYTPHSTLILVEVALAH
jgi:hypothetical protein